MPAVSSHRSKLEALLLGLAFAVYLYPLWHQAVLFLFQTRDLARATELLHGHPIFFGPEVTSGGFLPGPFYYYLLALPLLLGLGWKGSWILLVLFCGATVSTLWHFFRRHAGGALPALYAVLLFACSFPVSASIRNVLNSEFIFPLLAVMFSCLAVLFSPGTPEPMKQRCLRNFFLSLAFALQFHYSVIAVVPAFLILLVLGGRWGLARITVREAARSSWCLFPLAPYLLWRLLRLAGISLGQTPPSFAAVKALGSFFQTPYGTTTLITFRANEVFGFWFAVKEFLRPFHEFLFNVGPLTVSCYVVILAWLLREIAKHPRGEAEVPARVLFVCWLFAILPGLVGTGEGVIGVRYMGVTSLAFAMFVAAAGARLLPERIPRAIPAALFVLAPLYVALFGARSASVAARVASGGFETLPFASELDAAARAVVSDTGWSFEKFRDRAFYVNIFFETTGQTNYEEAFRAGKNLTAGHPANPDGFFLAQIITPGDEAAAARDFPRWLLAQNIPEPVAAGVRSGAIHLGMPAAFGRLRLAAYQVLDRDRFPPYFQNRSEHYENREQARIDAALREEAAAPERARVALFQQCPEWYCRFAIIARGNDLGDPATGMTVEIHGLALSLPTQHINPAWTESIHGVYLKYKCGSETRGKRIELASAVGYDPADSWILNHEFLAPYRRVLHLPCDSGQRITNLGFGFESGMVTQPLGEEERQGEYRQL